MSIQNNLSMIGQIFYNTRKSKNLKLNQMQELTGINKGTISKIENGLFSSIPPESIFSLSKVLELNHDNIFKLIYQDYISYDYLVIPTNLKLAINQIPKKESEVENSDNSDKNNMSNSDFNSYLLGLNMDSKGGKGLFFELSKFNSTIISKEILSYFTLPKYKNYILQFKDLYNNSPLHLAVKLRNFNVAKEFVIYGFSLFSENNNGFSPMSLLFTTFQENNSNSFDDIINFFEFCMKLISREELITEMNRPNKTDGSTAFLNAIKFFPKSLIVELINLGVDTLAVDRFGHNAIFYKEAYHRTDLDDIFPSNNLKLENNIGVKIYKSFHKLDNNNIICNFRFNGELNEKFSTSCGFVYEHNNMFPLINNGDYVIYKTNSSLSDFNDGDTILVEVFAEKTKNVFIGKIVIDKNTFKVFNADFSLLASSIDNIHILGKIIAKISFKEF